MSMVAVAIGSTVVGAGMSYYGANKADKANKRAVAANREESARQREFDLRERARMFGYVGPNGKAITSQSSDEDVSWALNNASPSTGAMPGYADQVTGIEGFEGQEFKKMVDNYSAAQDFWDSQEGMRKKQEEFFNNLPAARQEIAEKTFGAMGQIASDEYEAQAQIADAQGRAQSNLLTQALGGANSNVLQDTLQNFGGMGGGAATTNSLLANTMAYAPRAAAAELGGQSKASALRSKADMVTNPMASGLYEQLLGQQAKDYDVAAANRLNMMKQAFAPQSAFLQQSQAFAPQGFGAPRQFNPVFEQPNMAMANFGSQLGGGLMQMGTTLAGAKMNANAMKDVFGGGGGGGVVDSSPGYGTAPPGMTTQINRPTS